MATYYIATTGNDTTGDGSIGNPWATFQKAANSVAAGDTVYARGGTYTEYWISSTNGTAVNRITYSSYPGESAVVDGAGPARDDGSTLVSIRGDYTTIKNMELKNAANFCLMFYSGADNCTADNLHIHDNYRVGINLWSCQNATIQNCLVYNCYDYNSGGGNADGINSSDTGSGHRITDNVVHDCSDDGIDTWQATNSVVLRNVCYHNGYIPGTSTPAGNGTGIKTGSGSGARNNTVTDNVAWDNRTRGIIDNGSTGSVYYNNTSINNGTLNFWMLSSTSVLINNISYGQVNSIDAGCTQTTNTWNLGITDPSFVQITDPTLSTFARLQSTSSAINVGTTVGGSDHRSNGATDLGAFEYAPGGGTLFI